MIPFNINSKTLKIDVTSASVSTAIDSGSTIRIVNDGYSTVFVSVGSGAQIATIPTTTALSTCCPILPGQDVTFNMQNVLTGSGIQIATISSGASTIYVSVGDGI